MWEIESKYKLLCKTGERYVFYHRGRICISNSLKGTECQYISLPSGLIQKAMMKIRILERFARLEPRNAIPLNDFECLVSFQGQIIRVDLDGNMVIEHKYRNTMNNPLSFCAENDRILYGEYFANLNHQEVRIFERGVNGNWNVLFTFPKGEVQHIHQIKYDQFRNCYWILTGDSDSESAIWKVSPDFISVEAVFRGKQKYRSCYLMPTDEGLYYATDTPLEENWIYFAEQQGDNFLEPKKYFKLAGPCIYGKSLDNQNFIMATSVEPDPTLPTYRYYVTKKLGAGVRDRRCTLVYGNPDIGFSEVASFEKDCHRMWLFQFGNMLFPNISNDEGIICTGQSLKKIDGKTIRVIL